VLYLFCFQINTLLCYTLVSVLVLGIGIARGQYYWILGAFFGIILTLILMKITSLCSLQISLIGTTRSEPRYTRSCSARLYKTVDKNQGRARATRTHRGHVG